MSCMAAVDAGLLRMSRKTVERLFPSPPAFIFLFICTHGSIPVVLMVISPSETGVIHIGGNALLVNKKDPVIQTGKMGS